MVHTQQALTVSGQGSAIIQMTICTFSTLQATGPGPRVYKMLRIVSAPPNWTTAITDGLLTGFHCHQAGPVSGGTENVCQTTKYPKCGTQSACRVQTKSVLGNFGSLGGCTLGSTNVKGGLHSPFLVKHTDLLLR